MAPLTNHARALTGGRRMQIGEVAELCGLSLRTVRYYEEQGLIAPEARTEGASASTPTTRSSAWCSSSR